MLVIGSIIRGHGSWFNLATQHVPSVTRLGWHGFLWKRGLSQEHAKYVELQVMLKNACQPDCTSPALENYFLGELSC